MIVARPARAGLWADSNTVLTPTVCAALKAAGYAGAMRYVSLPGLSPIGDISGHELDVIARAGLQCLLVQHPRLPGWDPAAHDGAVDALRAITLARAAAYPAVTHVYLDLEGIKPGVSAEAIIRFADSWQAAILSAGYRAGLYRGYDVWLTADQLYDLRGFDSYWLAPGQPHTATRGDAIVQGTEVTIGGVKFDRNVVAPDMLGELPMAASYEDEAIAA